MLKKTVPRKEDSWIIFVRSVSTARLILAVMDVLNVVTVLTERSSYELSYKNRFSDAFA